MTAEHPLGWKRCNGSLKQARRTVLALPGELTDFSVGLMLTVEARSAGSLAALPCLGADSISQDIYAAGMRILLCPSLCYVHDVGLAAGPSSVGLG